MSNIQITLSLAESLVLFEWLSRLDSINPQPFEDPSEQTVAWRIMGQLESGLKEPFAPNYKELLAQARQKVQEIIE